jgi:predicted nuclease of predicted toxin-antitoxin system
VKLVIDMNLSPEWIGILASEGREVRHWRDLGAGTAPDEEILAWARNHNAVVVTQDLDFPRLLAMTHALGPSVVLLRVQDEFGPRVREQVRRAVVQCEADLAKGALVFVDDARARVRVLPIKVPAE